MGSALKAREWAAAFLRNLASTSYSSPALVRSGMHTICSGEFNSRG